VLCMYVMYVMLCYVVLHADKLLFREVKCAGYNLTYTRRLQVGADVGCCMQQATT
jgi:hypothetical protein